MKQISLFSILIIISFKTLANDYCTVRNWYKGAEGSVMRQFVVYDMKKWNNEPTMGLFSLSVIYNKDKVVEALYRPFFKKTEGYSIIHSDSPKKYIEDGKKIMDKYLATRPNGQLFYPCPYWMKSWYDKP